MKSDSNKDTTARSCGKCGKTIKMRDDMDSVLCTAILDMVDADFEDVCEHYVDRPEHPDQ